MEKSALKFVTDLKQVLLDGINFLKMRVVDNPYENPQLKLDYNPDYVAYLRAKGSDAENDLINKITNEEIVKFQRTFSLARKELLANDQLTREFQRSSSASEHIRVSVFPNTPGAHNLHEHASVVVPSEARRFFDQFDNFYKSKNPRKRLTLMPQYGRVEMRAQFGKGPKPDEYTLGVSTFQMCILMLLNDHEVLTFTEICTKTKITTDIVKESLQGFLRNQVLLKSGEGKGK